MRWMDKIVHDMIKCIVEEGYAKDRRIIERGVRT